MFTNRSLWTMLQICLTVSRYWIMFDDRFVDVQNEMCLEAVRFSCVCRSITLDHFWYALSLYIYICFRISKDVSCRVIHLHWCFNFKIDDRLMCCFYTLFTNLSRLTSVEMFQHVWDVHWSLMRVLLMLMDVLTVNIKLLLMLFF